MRYDKDTVEIRNLRIVSERYLGYNLIRLVGDVFAQPNLLQDMSMWGGSVDTHLTVSMLLDYDDEGTLYRNATELLRQAANLLT